MPASPIHGPEPIVRQAVATLQRDLPGVLAAEAAKWNDSVVLDDIATWGYGGNDVTTYPTLEVSIPDLDLNNLSIAQLAGDAGYRVHIRCSILGPDPTTIYFMCCRYLVAIIAVLMQPDAFGAGLIIDRNRGMVGRIRGGDLETQSGATQMYGTTILTFWIAAYESRV